MQSAGSFLAHSVVVMGLRLPQTNIRQSLASASNRKVSSGFNPTFVAGNPAISKPNSLLLKNAENYGWSPPVMV